MSWSTVFSLSLLSESAIVDWARWQLLTALGLVAASVPPWLMVGLTLRSSEGRVARRLCHGGVEMPDRTSLCRANCHRQCINNCFDNARNVVLRQRIITWPATLGWR